jgi:adenylate cyclase
MPETPTPEPEPTERLPEDDQDFVAQLIGHHLRQDDIRRLLLKLSTDDREEFTEKLAAVLRRTAALLEVSRRVADSLSLDVLLPRMVELVSEFLDAERCTIFLHDPETDELYTRAAVGLSSEIRLGASQGIAGTVFRSGQPVSIPDAYADPRFNPDVDKKTGFRTRNILCAPITRSREGALEVVGVAQVLNKRGGDFDYEDVTVLRALMSQAASAFVNAQLHDQIARARAEESQLLEVTTAMTTELQLQPLLRKIMETVCMILDADRATLFLHDPRTDELWARLPRDEGSPEIRFASHLGIAGAVFTSGHTINIKDAYADPRFNREFDKRTSFKTRSILCMPVVNRRGRVIAVTQVLNKKGGPFTGIDEKRLKAFSAQAAIAMENAQLFDEVVRVKNYNESILESMSNGVITVGHARNIVKLNRAALRILGRRDATLVMGQNVREFFVGPNAWVAEAVEKVEQGGAPVVAMDADLRLSDEVSPAGETTPRVVSVNLSVVPLGAHGDPDLGCMLMLEDITNEKRLKGTMARYMPKEVADRLLEEGASALGGKTQKATVLFSDIRSFTTISERLGAQETVKMLNDYFGLMVDVILERGGILDKYIGDAIMAVFGAPFSSLQDADNAVLAALGMRHALRGFNQRRAAEGLAPVRMGLGLNTDEVLSGNIGSLKRMDYTVIGDGVNLASRLEGANKHYGTEILISELTVRELQGEYLLREVDQIRVKGKLQPIGVFEVFDELDERDHPGLREQLRAFAAARAIYQQRDWSRARAAFDEALSLRPDDRVSRLYLERCAHFTAEPPEDDWDGVFVMREK